MTEDDTPFRLPRPKLYLKMQQMCLCEGALMTQHIWTSFSEVATVKSPSKSVETKIWWCQRSIDQLGCQWVELVQEAEVDRTFTAIYLDQTLIQSDPAWVSSQWTDKNISKRNTQMSTTVHLQCKSSAMKKHLKIRISVKRLFMKRKDKIIWIRFNRKPIC